MRSRGLASANGGGLRPPFQIGVEREEEVEPTSKDDLDVAAVERELLAIKADLRDRTAELSRPPERGSGVQFGKRIGDGTTEAVSRLTDVGVVESLVATEERVTRALEKIAEGTYGICDGCGKAIPRGRLEAAPESTKCVACAELTPHPRRSR
jgi:DnaK suppressor protein